MGTTNVSPSVDLYMDMNTGVVLENDDLVVASNYMHTNPPGTFFDSALKFDLSAISGTLVSAVLSLKLYQTGYGGAGDQPKYVYCCRHRNPANIANTMTLAQMNDYEATPVDSVGFHFLSDPPPPLWMAFDVTAAITLGALNGFVLYHQSPLGNRTSFFFRAHNYVTGADRPVLQITTAASGFVPRITIC